MYRIYLLTITSILFVSCAYSPNEQTIINEQLVYEINLEGEKVPCIMYDDNTLKEIYPYLKEWGYYLDRLYHPCKDDIIILNPGGYIGKVTNVPKNFIKCHNRELVNDKEEFLKRAAKIKGYEYEIQ